MGPNVVEYMSKSKHHVWGLVETHLKAAKSAQAVKDIKANNWIASASAADDGPNSAKGSHGGAFLAHKTWLQTATPAEASGQDGCNMPDADIIYKYFRIKGKTLCICFVYFDCGVGLAGKNLDKLQKIEEIKDKNHMDTLVIGDFNMQPKDWNEEVLNRMDMQIMTADSKYTCRNSFNAEGGSIIDYVLVSRSIAALIKNISTVGGEDGQQVPWSPHVGISLEVHGDAAALWTREQRKPKPLPLAKDEKGRFARWNISDEKWNELYESAEHKAKVHIEGKNTTHSDQGKYVERIGNQDKAYEKGILYAQWSMAAEAAQIKVNGDSNNDDKAFKGRGCTPSFCWKNGYDKSSDKPIQHHQWQMKNKHAIMGADLYTTMWSTIASMLRRIAAEVKKDFNDGDGTHKHTVKGYYRDIHFLNYLTLNMNSPIRAAMTKAPKSQSDKDEWIRRLWWPYHQHPDVIAE